MHLIGSTRFFQGFEGFTPHDMDYLEIIETDEFKHVRRIRFNGNCYFQLRKKSSPEEYIEWDLQHSLGMALGKYLVPEVAQEMNLTVDKLELLRPFLDKLDVKHAYEKIIFDSYVINQSFTLTDEQLNAAYNSYLETRGLSTVD